MEERIIDDVMGRGIRLKKTKDGYVDVTDELAPEEEEVEEAGEEIAVVLPDLEGETLEGVLDSLTPSLLKAFKSALSKKKSRLEVQLASKHNEAAEHNNEFVI